MEELGRGRFVRLVRRDRWEWAERVNARAVALILAVTPDDRVLLVEQHRPPVGGSVLSWPAGLVGDDGSAEPVAEAARRELEEETGWRASRIEQVAEGPISAGMTSERLTVFRAFDLERAGPGGGVDGERITVHEVPRAEVVAFAAARARQGVATDLKLFAGLYLLSAGA